MDMCMLLKRVEYIYVLTIFTQRKVNKNERLEGSLNICILQIHNSDQIYRTQSCLIVTMITVLTIQYGKLFPVGKLRDVSDGTRASVLKIMTNTFWKEVLYSTRTNISLNKYGKSQTLVQTQSRNTLVSSKSC